MFTEQACRTPDNIAVASEFTAHTYAELDFLTDLLAHQLRASGVGPEAIVGCWSHDSVSTVILVLSVLKAGGAYLLLDPHLPVDRLRYMIEDADPVGIVCDERPPAEVAGRYPVLLMDEIAQSPNALAVHSFADVSPDNLAYVAYTSGSTGRPKGVLVTHASVTNHARALRAQFDLRPGDRLPLMAPIAFDVATEEILPPLVSGCTLLATPDHSPSMQEFTDDVVASSYTILNIPAPLWHQWTTYLRYTDRAIPSTLRLVIVGSDKIYTSMLDEWKLLRGAEKVWWVAAYGITEATVTSLLYLTAARDDLSGEPLVPIGTPLENVSAYVVGDDGRPVSPGDSGELYLGGVGLARGYQRLPAKTAERFIDDPFGSAPGSRRYRTGDLVRTRPDGALVWLGRQDSQIKINGLRIEPAEIEAVIHQHPSVGEAIVVFQPPTVAGDAGSLVAYLAAKMGCQIDTSLLRSDLTAQLHPLMVPEAIVVLEHIPLNANGKLDRKCLESSTFEAAC